MRDRPREEQTAVTDSSSETRRGAGSHVLWTVAQLGRAYRRRGRHRGARGGRSRLRLVCGHRRRRNCHRSRSTDSLPQSPGKPGSRSSADDSLRRIFDSAGPMVICHRPGRLHHPHESLRRAAAGISRCGVGGTAQDSRHPRSRRRLRGSLPNCRDSAGSNRGVICLRRNGWRR